MSGELSGFEEKFQLLLRRMRLLKDERQRLRQRLEEREAKIEEQQERLERLEEKIKVLRMTSAPEDGYGADKEFRKEAQATINFYIKEIDNCIALLNQ